MASKPSRIKTLLDTAIEYQQKQKTRWDNNVKLYEGEITQFRNKILPTWAHMVEVNFTRPIVDTMIPSLLFTNPKILINSGKEIAPQEVVMQALQIENEMNAIHSELDAATEIKKCLKDALILGIGVLKYGLTDEFSQFRKKYPFLAPFMKRFSPWDFLVDPAARNPDLSDADFVAFRMVVPLEDAKSDKLLKNADKLTADSQFKDIPDHIRENVDRIKSNMEFVTLYEFWDKRKQVFYILDHEGTIYRQEKWPYNLHGEFPCVTYTFNDVPERFYAKGEPEYIYSLQLEASEKRTQQLNHTRRFNRKYRVSPDMTAEDVDSLRKGDDGTVVKSRDPIEAIPDAPLQMDIYKEYEMIFNEVKEVSGISAYQRGGNESAVYSATAAKIIDAASNIRVEERKQVVAKAIGRGARILYDIMAPMKKWPEMAFNFIVDVSTMLRPDDEGRRQQLMQLGQIAGAFPEFRRVQWLRDLALTFHKPPEQYVLTDQELQAQAQQQAQNDPAAAKAQADMQMMQMKMQADQAKAQIDMQVAQQKAQIEMELGRMKIQAEKMKLEMEAQKMQLEYQGAQMDMEVQAQKMQMDVAKSRLDMAANAEQTKMKHEDMKAQSDMKNEHMRQMGDTKLETAKKAAKAAAHKPKSAKGGAK